MMNIQGIMKQAQMMQKKMEEAQEKLAQQEITGTSGGGLVKITLNGKFEAKKIEIDKSLLVPEEVDILEDLILAAYNEAHANLHIGAKYKFSSYNGSIANDIKA